MRIIQGDGIDFEMLDNILYAMQKAGFSADNISFGSGGGLLQKLNRDTLQFAFKCAEVVVDGKARDVYKSPVTDREKRSKSGRMKLVKAEGSRGAAYRTAGLGEPGEDQLVEVFRDGGHPPRLDLCGNSATRENNIAKLQTACRFASHLLGRQLYCCPGSGEYNCHPNRAQQLRP